MPCCIPGFESTIARYQNPRGGLKQSALTTLSPFSIRVLDEGRVDDHLAVFLYRSVH